MFMLNWLEFYGFDGILLQFMYLPPFNFICCSLISVQNKWIIRPYNKMWFISTLIERSSCYRFYIKMAMKSKRP